MYSVVIADDEKLICDGIKSVIESALPELEIKGIFHNGTSLYDYLHYHQPDILLLDIQMPGKSGLDIARFIHEQNHKSYMIIITAHHEFEYAKDAINYNVDAFITKPFSSCELADIIRQAISAIKKKHISAINTWTVYRSLIKNLLLSQTNDFLYNEIRLCNGTTEIKDLHCTELSINDSALQNLNDDTRSSLSETLCHHAESDTFTQSVFCLGMKNSFLTFLIFSREDASLSFLPDTLQIVSKYTGAAPQYTTQMFPSFSDYRIYSSFLAQMEHFFNTLTGEGSPQAKKQLTDYIYSLPSQQCHDFALFLENNYQLTVDGTDADTVVLCLDTLISQSLGNHPGNYLVDSAKKYISKNYASSSLSLDAVADALSISSYYLSRIFRKYTGQNFSEYLLSFRMEQAKELLKTTEWSTIKIAEAVGYNNPAYFRVSFKAYFDMTPRQFRILQTRKEQS